MPPPEETAAISPVAVVSGIAACLATLRADPKFREEGVHKRCLSAEEWPLVRACPELFGFFFEPGGGTCVLVDALEERKAYRAVMDHLQTSALKRPPVAASQKSGGAADRRVEAVINRLLDSAVISDVGGAVEFSFSQRTQLPWRPLRPAAEAPPGRGPAGNTLIFPEADLAASIPRVFAPPKRAASLVGPLREFARKNAGVCKLDLLIAYIRQRPLDVVNSPKMMAEVTWLFFASDQADEERIMFHRTMGWLVFDAYWRRDDGNLLRSTTLLQGELAQCVVELGRYSAHRNLWKARNGKPHPRTQFLEDLQTKVSDCKGVASLLQEARPYFLREEKWTQTPTCCSCKTLRWIFERTPSALVGRLILALGRPSCAYQKRPSRGWTWPRRRGPAGTRSCC